MFNFSRYTPDDPDQASSSGAGLDNVLERAKQRQKRKRQEESFSSRSNVAAEASDKKQQKHKSKVAARPVRVETLEERDSRKAAAKAARKNHKDGGDEMVPDAAEAAKLTAADLATVSEILAVQQRQGQKGKAKKDKGKRARRDSVGSEASEGSVTATAQTETAAGESARTVQGQALARHGAGAGAGSGLAAASDHIVAVEEEDASEGMDMDSHSQIQSQSKGFGFGSSSTKAKAEPAAFVEQLFRASKESLPRAARVEDEDDEAMDSTEPIAPAPPPVSVAESMKQWGVSPVLIENLTSMGITGFFPVQRSVIPSVIKSHSLQYMQPRDLCVSAPTGSGKTIAYSLPILQTLLGREVVRLRALILLPSRDLAMQVHTVLKTLTKNTGLEVGLVTGQQGFEEEQSSLVGNIQQDNRNPRNSVSELSFSADMSNKKLWQSKAEPDGHSLVDVLVCTPGRLLDHLEYTAGFTLQHIRFLVLDEADRLLSNAYHGWISTLVQGVQTVRMASTAAHTGTAANSKLKDQSVQGFLNQSTSPPLQRLLFSATLTDNPRKLAMLNIRNPEVIRARAADGGSGLGEAADAGEEEELGGDDDVTAGFILPSTLTESMITCDAARRPHILVTTMIEAFARVDKLPALTATTSDEKEEQTPEFNARHKAHIICQNPGDLILVFASSVDTVHRLSRLLQILNGQSKNLLFGGEVVEMNRLVKADDRERILQQCRDGKIAVLVASDNMARGIDLPNIKLVINYDPPKFARSYVHRVGRTARANRAGHCLTIVMEGQLGTFKKMRSQISHSSSDKGQGLNKCKPGKTVEASVAPLVRAALKLLPASLQAE